MQWHEGSGASCLAYLHRVAASDEIHDRRRLQIISQSQQAQNQRPQARALALRLRLHVQPEGRRNAVQQVAPVPLRGRREVRRLPAALERRPAGFAWVCRHGRSVHHNTYEMSRWRCPLAVPSAPQPRCPCPHRAPLMPFVRRQRACRRLGLRGVGAAQAALVFTRAHPAVARLAVRRARNRPRSLRPPHVCCTIAHAVSFTACCASARSQAQPSSSRCPAGALTQPHSHSLT